MEMVFTFTLVPPHHHPGHLFPFASIYYLPSVIVNFSICSVLLSVQLCPPPLKNLTPVGFDKHVVLQMGHSHRAPHTRLYKHKYDIFTNTRNTCSHVGAK